MVMVLSDVLPCALYNILCPCWFWPWYCLTFFEVFCISLFVLVGFGHGSVWRSSMCFTIPWQKTNKDKPCYTKHIEERQTISWPKPTRTNNVIQNTSKNVRHYHNIVCPCWFWPWYCLTFSDVFLITLFVLVGFGTGIVWHSSMYFA
jgi:hypothetical protein